MHKIEFFVELKYYSKDEVFLFFKNASLRITELIEKRYLRTIGSGFQFFFVGIIEVDSTIIVILPKYVEGDVSYERAMDEGVRLIKVLRKIGKTYSKLPDFENISYSKKIYNEISLADSLISDYIENGLLRLQRNETILNGIGATNWEKTVSMQSPVFSKGQPFYLDLLNEETIVSDLSIIAVIHKWILKSIIEKYGRILGYELSNIDSLNVESTISLDISLIRSMLQKELQSAYTDRNIRVLERLFAYIDKSYLGTHNNSFNLYGTGYFHLVWEEICKNSFNDQMPLFQRLIAKPIWISAEGEENYSETLRPDILCFSQDDAQVTFVLDAKYYNFKFNEIPRNGLINNPGIGDLTKQFLYKVLVEKIIEGEIITAFLFPRIQTEQISFLGHVKFSGFDSSRILLFSLSTSQFLDEFLSDKHLGIDCLPRLRAATEKEVISSRF